DAAGVRHTEALFPLRPGPTFAVDPVAAEKAQERAEAKAMEVRRSRTAAAGRYRLQKRFVSEFRAEFAKIVGREVKQLRRFLASADSPEQFLSEVDAFYDVDRLRDKEDPREGGHMEFVERDYSRLLTAYGGAVADETVAELNLEAVPDAFDLSLWVARYVRRFSRRHAARSTNQLKAIVRRAAGEGVVEAIGERLVEWEEKRPEKIAEEESVSSAGSTTRALFITAGVISMQWVAFGDNCPLCDELNGQTVGVREAFVGKGQSVNPEDEDTEPLTVRHAVLHAPLHAGCDCVVVAA
ncbi:MAG TPA: hypothetical protein VK966_10270, partial [Longimicrobiales bacterium]|nr:hypothetical protein [Longimicrobiales bacterium]